MSAQQYGLYDPFTEHDACGVGFVCQISGKPFHQIVQDGLTVLENLAHRGATGADPLTGDGAGILVQMPDLFFRGECARLNMDLPSLGQYAAGIFFMPTEDDQRRQIEVWIEQLVREEGLRVLGWRDVPHDSSRVGSVARSVEPEFRQLFVARGESVPLEKFEMKLFVVRKRIMNKVAQSDLFQKKYFYVCSLSSRTIVYKGQLMADQLRTFYADLADERFSSSMAIVHSRYSTNTFPSWSLAHPFRMIAHNGEINTVRGNVNWMRAREKHFESADLGPDIQKALPVVEPNGSDSAAFDNALEMMVFAGRSLPHAIMMMIPEAWNGHESMDQQRKDFYQYHSCLMEPWDGPASIVFTDGRYVGAVLDRNGLRPSRFLETKEGVIVMASETGVLPKIASDQVKMKGRLQPGKMFLIDTKEGRIIDDQELKQLYSTKKPYGQWLSKNMIELEDLPDPPRCRDLDEKTLLKRQKAFGYTLEDLKIVLHPMAVSAQEATGSMGTDTPLAVLSDQPQPLYNYFKQLFAQVTNPPIDPIREEIVMAQDVMLGGEQNLLQETEAHCRRLHLKRPVLTNKEIEKIRRLKVEGLRSVTLDCVFEREGGAEGLRVSLEKIFEQADAAIGGGATILILSDRSVDARRVQIPAFLACSGLHHHLVRQGTRTSVSLVVETGEAREIHHFALLIGYGANAVNPYLVFETLQNEAQQKNFPVEIAYQEAEKNFLKATRKGLLKIISKMGISTIQSYCGAQIFEAVGIGQEVIDRYFTGTSSRIGGIGLDVIARETMMRHERGYPTRVAPQDPFLDVGGFYQWRKDGEYHQINPETIAQLQYAVRANDQASYDRFAKYLNETQTNQSTIRSLLKFKKGNPIPLNEVEPATEIVKRFATGAMSYGSISKAAHECLAVAMNRLGGFSNTGEGGEDPDRFVPLSNGDSRRSRIKQIAQGRFGVTIEYLVNADQMQIKMAQGAKPGEGGQLPGHKVSEQIAKTRHTTPGVGLISPPPHHDIYSIEDLAQLIYDLKNANPSADVSVKLVSEVGVGTVAAGVSKGKADHVLISGYEGGTGASPQTSIKHAGLPLELGLAETQQVLVMNDLRGRIRVQADGQIRTGRDVVMMAMLGADEFGFATIALVAMGCMMLRKCHQNACSVGIATQDPELCQKFAGKPEHVVNYFMFVAEDVRRIMAELGFRRFEEMVGRADMLDLREHQDHWKAKHLDLSAILYRPAVAEHVAIRHTEKQTHGLEHVLDQKLLAQTKEAIEQRKKICLEMPISNVDRTVGTMLSSRIARQYGMAGLPDDSVRVKFLGPAGQSFGAFLSHGVTLELEGDANDYLGKGLSGGRIIVCPPKTATFIPRKNILVGNVLFYGAIKGEGFIRGMAGERFCVRNSGISAVVEGVGDHGCEYMTGGRVVVIGPTGRNFGAGMSGGIAYVWNVDGKFLSRCNLSMVELYRVIRPEDQKELRELLEKHAAWTGSTAAKQILSDWSAEIQRFVKVYPADYRRVLEGSPQIVGEEDILKDEALAKEQN